MYLNELGWLDTVPSITDLLRIMGRASMKFTDWVYLDLLYTNHLSLWLDIQIIVCTVLAVLDQRGAH